MRIHKRLFAILMTVLLLDVNIPDLAYAEDDIAVAFEDEDYGIINILGNYFGFELVGSSVNETEEGGHVYSYIFQDADGNILVANVETTSLGGIVGDHITWAFVPAK